MMQGLRSSLWRMVRNGFSLLGGAVLLAAPAGLSTAGALWGQDDVSSAVSVLPEAERAGATVRQLQDGAWVTLREGAGSFICLADAPGDDRFHVACYHESLEPYMARGRELREEGVTGMASLERRWEEIDAGTLEMPSYAMLHQIFAGADWDGDMETANVITVIYVPHAEAEDLGLPTSPSEGPWMMFPGKASAHIMIAR